ncbi:ABC transporter substrate-binding protein [Streptomyces sp. NPDC019396]|uniref:ABC transporter substrate-binding protein n=1 Tax=Streptomyces sp. NPDC019396 TaxID=3154687 RepID=UPI0033EF5C73
MNRWVPRAGVAVTVVSVLAACGTEPGGLSSQNNEFSGRGPITIATGKDNSTTLNKIIDKWNVDHPDELVRAVELSDSPDQQRQRMIQDAELKSGEFAVLDLDVVWTAEFAANRWIMKLPDDIADPTQFLKPTIEAASYRDGLYAVPVTSDAGLLFYRSDLLEKSGKKPPKTWGEMQATCKKVLKMPEAKGMSCYAGQFDKYEGLTVNFAEMVDSAGGRILDDKGSPHVDSQEAARALTFFRDGIKNGLIAEKAITYKEEEGRQAFQKGELVFHRQWPYQWSLANDAKSSKVSKKFSVAPLPGLDGPGVSSLGGHNLAVSPQADNKATALDFVKFMTSEKTQRDRLLLGSNAPTRAALYDDADLIAKYPYLPELKQSINTANPRPRVVHYGDATAAIQDEAYKALTGESTPEQALANLQKKLHQLKP